MIRNRCSKNIHFWSTLIPAFKESAFPLFALSITIRFGKESLAVNPSIGAVHQTGFKNGN
jgi:hypothetical protein